jgi:DNA-binding IclR family transcriptional regulator
MHFCCAGRRGSQMSARAPRSSPFQACRTWTADHSCRFAPSWTNLCQQWPSAEVDVDQRKRGEGAGGVLRKAAVAHLAKGLSELARTTGVNKTTVLRICSSLERRGYLRRDSHARYTLGPASCALGKHYEADIHLDDVVIPVLVAVARTCRESASFHVRSGDTRLCIYRVNADHSVIDNVRTGDRLPLKLGAPGKVLLAYSGTKGKDFDEIRKSGFAMSLGDRDPECAAVSAPVFMFGQELCGALSVSGPQPRFSRAFAQRILPHLVAAAQRISRGMGADSGVATAADRAGSRKLPSWPRRRASDDGHELRFAQAHADRCGSSHQHGPAVVFDEPRGRDIELRDLCRRPGRWIVPSPRPPEQLLTVVA